MKIFKGSKKNIVVTDTILYLLSVYFDVSTTYVVLTYDYKPLYIVFQAFYGVFFTT
jgi:hypothetical protein